MNKGFHKYQHNYIRVSERGNAMVYILVALALFGFLTVTLSRQNQQADSRTLNKENLNLYVNEIIEYTIAAGQTIDRMLITGSEVSDLDFTKPNEAGFDAPPHIHKVFHPQGGGLNYQDKPTKPIQNTADSVWDFNSNINVEWTPSTENDVILTAYHINKSICERINITITGSSVIPVTNAAHNEYFLNTGTRDLDITECADCEGRPALCVENSASDNYSYYQILEGQ